MSKKDITNWARELIQGNPNIPNSEGYLKHLEVTYDMAEETAKEIISRYRGLDLDIEETALAAGLHDIGIPLKKDKTFHEIRGSMLIEKEGFARGVAETQAQVYKIAQIMLPHGLVYEQWLNPINAELRNEFGEFDSRRLVPKTLPQAIVIYSDLSNNNGERMEVESRLKEARERYGKDEKYKNRSGGLADAIIEGHDRVCTLCKKVKLLSEGRLLDHDISNFFSY